MVAFGRGARRCARSRHAGQAAPRWATWLAYELLVHDGMRWYAWPSLGVAYLVKTSVWPWLVVARRRLAFERSAKTRRSQGQRSGRPGDGTWVAAISLEFAVSHVAAGRQSLCWYRGSATDARRHASWRARDVRRDDACVRRSGDDCAFPRDGEWTYLMVRPDRVGAGPAHPEHARHQFIELVVYWPNRRGMCLDLMMPVPGTGHRPNDRDTWPLELPAHGDNLAECTERLATIGIVASRSCCRARRATVDRAVTCFWRWRSYRGCARARRDDEVSTPVRWWRRARASPWCSSAAGSRTPGRRRVERKCIGDQRYWQSIHSCAPNILRAEPAISAMVLRS